MPSPELQDGLPADLPDHNNTMHQNSTSSAVLPQGDYG